MRCTQYNHDSECAANNAQDKIHKDPWQNLYQPRGEAARDHDGNRKPCVLTGSRHTRLQNPATYRTTPGNTGPPRVTPDETNQKQNPAIAANWPGKRISLPVMHVQSGKNHPEAESCHGIAPTFKANQRIGIISLYAFFFCPISPRSQQNTKRDMRKQSI